MKHFRGSLSVVATCALVAGCSSGPREGEANPPDTVTVTYSSSTSNAPTTKTITPSATSSRSSSSSSSSTTQVSPSPGQSAPTSTQGAPSTTAAPAKDDDKELPTGTTAYADGFVRAWGAGDRAKAGRYATAGTVASLFGQESLGGTSWQRQSSSDEGARTRVRYVNASGRTLDVLVNESAAASGSSHGVVGATLGSAQPAPTTSSSTSTTDSPDAVGLPRSVTDYADAMIRAWGKDDPISWDFTTEAVMTKLYAEWGAGGPGWSRSASTGSSVTYTNKDGSTLVLDVNADRVSKGLTGGVTGARFS